MPEVTKYEPGTPSWIDMGTSDLEGAIAFYSGLFGWEIEIGAPELGRYSNALVRGKPVAGLADQQEPGMPIFWATYISVDDVDQTVDKVKKANGSVIVEPMDVMEYGRMAVTMDSGGTPISFWQPNEHIGAAIVNEPGTLCWNELTTRAVDESIEFYGAVVGWEAQKMDYGDGSYYMWNLNGKPVGGMMPMEGDMWPPEVPDHWMVYFAVDDTDASAAKVIELGGQVPVPPTDIPAGRFAVANDPQGGHFSIIKMAPQPT